MADAALAAIARNVRAARGSRGWSLDALAARSGVSKGVLVTLEQGRSNPNLGTLVRISDAFGLPLTELLDAGQPPPIQPVPAGTGTVLWRGQRGGTGALLTGVAVPAGVELWRWRMEPGEQHGSEAHAAGTRELIHVLRGELTVTVDGDAVTIGPGDSARMAGDRPHSYANEAGSPAEYVGVVIVPPAPRSG